MKDILEYIKNQETKLLQLRFFHFLTDTNIDLNQRLSWFYCLADIAMSFKDLNYEILKDKLSKDICQKSVNHYLVADISPWQGYLKSLETLENNQVIHSSDSLKFMLNEKTLKTRRLANNLIAMCRYETDFLLKILLIAAIDATGSLAIKAIEKISEELELTTNQSDFSCSHKNLKIETENLQSVIKNDDKENVLFSMEMNPEQKAQALVLVDYVFDQFTECMHGLMQLAQQHNYQALPAQPLYTLR